MPSFVPPDGVPVLFHAIVPGRVVVKKNSRPLFVTHAGRPGMGKSKALRACERLLTSTFGLLWAPRQPLTGPLWVVTRVFQSDRRWEPDLLAPQETVWDCLEDAGILAVDKLIESSDGSRKILDRGGETRVEVHVMPFSPS